jgi:hypothetical protein
MPDLHDLLAEATARTPHPDPVTAVHRAVHRRAARRRAAVAVGASSALVAAGVTYVARPARHAVPPVASASPWPTPEELPPGPEWRLRPHADSNFPPDRYWEGFKAVRDYVLAHPDVFGHFEHLFVDAVYTPTVSIGSDVTDAAVWEARVRAAAPSFPVKFERCTVPAPTLDRYRAEVVATTWPSGRQPEAEPYVFSDAGFGPCTLMVELAGPNDDRDDAYAREHWGDVVGILGSVSANVSMQPVQP